ncbi:MAG: 3-deoxy-8-phosphooctulonate synthase [Ignavibacteriae bacterium]|nr:3-deoxy-8-phosphooctulonate synthase [Ignavibacteriota bacterium]
MNDKLLVIAGPCVVESKKLLKDTAGILKFLCDTLNCEFIFKSSYKKANRTSVDSFTGIGEDIALQYLKEIKEEFNVRVLTDIHSVEDAEKAAQYVDVLQIPAFLCRQTELLQAAARTGKTINIKKGQFMAPEDMKKAIDKVVATGNNDVMVTERGSSFGYHDLVVDFRSLVIMKKFGYPVIFDATHSIQQPSLGKESGGRREFVPALARAAAAVGINGIFFETHPEPEKALSDSASQLPLEDVDEFLTDVCNFYECSKQITFI